MKLPVKLALASLLAAALATNASAQNATATTDPVGFVTVNVTAGTGSVKNISLISVPLLGSATINGSVSGSLTEVTSNSLSDSAAGWTAGDLSNPSTPYLIQITSGSAAGKMFVISTTSPNTPTTITISNEDSAAFSDLTTLGIAAGDGYKILPCDTLSSFFGSPADSGVLGSTSAVTADTIVLCVNGNVSEYYYDTSLSRWTLNNRSKTDASNVVVRPDSGIRYSRLADTPLSLTVSGNVPTIERKATVKDSGPTYLSQFWPVESTIASLNLQNLSSWTSAPSAQTADLVTVYSNGLSATYFFDGTNWRLNNRSLTISDNVTIPVGASLIITQRGSETSSSVISQALPYSL